MEDIRDQVERTEDLIRLHITEIEKNQEISIQVAQEHTDNSKTTRNEIFAVIGFLFGLLGTLLSTTKIDYNTFSFWFIILSIISVMLYFAWNARLRQLNNALGEDIAHHDQRIEPLRKSLEYLVLMTINAYQGHFEAIREVATFISYLNDATLLYQIKPYEKLIKTRTFPLDNNKVMRERINQLKGEANYFYKQYMKLKHERIPEGFRLIIEKVFKDNEEFINRHSFAEPI